MAAHAGRCGLCHAQPPERAAGWRRGRRAELVDADGLAQNIARHDRFQRHAEPGSGDRQHPHDLFMQLSAAWRVALSSSTSLTISGGPVDSPALGPVAFMHRASAFDNPLAPLTHHLFDSTHVSFGVATAALEHGPWTLEGSVFNGREPDEHRWDFDFGRMDSVSGRLWFKPTAQWAFQVSTGHLVHPEQFEPGNAERTTVSASWTRVAGQTIDSVTAGFGSNDGPEPDFVRNGGVGGGGDQLGATTGERR